MAALLVAAIFVMGVPAAASAAVVINEIMYDPQGTDSGHEWLEIHNDTAGPVDLTGWRLAEGGVDRALTLVQGSFTLPAGGHAIIVSSGPLFLADYSTHPAVGSWTVLRTNFSSLTNTGETLALKNAALAVQSSVSYSATAPWPAMLTGSSSLERVLPAGGDNDPANWASSRARGTPGSANAPLGATTPVLAPMGTVTSGDYTVAWSTAANAVLYQLQESLSPDFSAPSSDTVVASTSIALTGRAGGTYHYRVRGRSANGINGDWSAVEDVVVSLVPPPGTPAIVPMGTFASGDYTVAWSTASSAFIYELQESTAADFSVLLNSFWPTSASQSVAGRANGTYHYRVRAWSALPENSGVPGAWSAAEDAVVAVPTVPLGAIVVNEILYDPAGTDSNREWVELHNKSGQAVDLAGWEINDGSDHALAFVQGGSVIPAGGFAVVAASASVFIAEYSTAGSSGWIVIDSVLSLTNASDTVAIKDDLGVVHSSLTYTSTTPWPVAGNGKTLERISPNGPDADPANWQAGPAGGSPGAETLPALLVPTLNAIPAVFNAVGTPSGSTMAVSGAGSPNTDAVVVVRVNGNTFEQSPIFIDGSGNWSGVVGIFGAHGDAFTLSVYGKRGAQTTVESATQTTVLQLLVAPAAPVLVALGTSTTGSYAVAWSSVANAGIYEVQESTDSAFAGIRETRWPVTVSESFTGRPSGVYFYRVRGWTSTPETSGIAGPWSAAEDMVVNLAPPPGSVVVNEILYDPAGTDSNREWVEVHNKTGAPIDLAGWKIFDGSDHALTPVQGGSVVPAGGFAVIAASASVFVAEYSTAGSAGWIVFDTVLSLTNASDTVAIKDASNVVHSSLTYASTAPWPVAGNGRTLERIDPNGPDADPANWQASVPGGRPGQATLPALNVPTLSPVPRVFAATGTSGGFLNIGGAGTPNSDAIVVVRINGNTFEQSPIYVDETGNWSGQVGIFGADADLFALSVYGRRPGEQTAESAAQPLTLELNGVPNLDPVPAVFSATGTPNGAFMPVSGTALPNSQIYVVVRINGNSFLSQVGVDGSGAFASSAGLFGADGDVFRLSLRNVSGNTAEGPVQAAALDLDGNTAGAPRLDPVPAVFSSTGTGGLLTVSGDAAPGSDVIVTVRVNGNDFEQAPLVSDAAGRWTGQVGIFGNDNDFFQIRARSERGADVSPDSPARSTVLDLDGNPLSVPAMDPLPAVFVATGTVNGAFMPVAGFGTPGSSVTVRVRLDGNVYDQVPALVGPDGRYLAQAGLFGADRTRFTLSAFARLNAFVSVECATQSVVLDLTGPPAAPAIVALGTSTTRDYTVAWNAVPEAFIYELQESTVASFASVTETRWPTPTAESFTGKADGTYYYRVRAWNDLPENAGLPSAWSAAEDVVVAYQFPAGGVVVTEILYDPAGTDTNREWVEIHNKSGAPADLTGWKINDGSDHSLTFVQGGSVLPAGGYAVIAASAGVFIAEYSTAGSAGWMVIDSVLSLSNTADVVAIKDAGNVVHSSLTYTSTAPWPVATNGKTLERISPDGPDADPANWQAGVTGGRPGQPTLPALSVPTLSPTPYVLVSTATPAGRFMDVGGAGTPNSDVVVVVRVNGNTFEQSPIYVGPAGTWSGQVGIFGADGTQFQISAYGKRGAEQSAESAPRVTILETDGVPNPGPIPAVFTATGTPNGAFLAVTGTALPNALVVPVVRVNGGVYEQPAASADASGVFSASAGLFGADGDVFRITVRAASGNTAESAAQAAVLDLDGNPAAAPRVAALNTVFSSTGTGGFLAVSGESVPGADVVVTVRANGNDFEQTPIFVNPDGSWSGQVGIFGADGDIFQLRARAELGANVSPDSPSQTVVLDLDGNPLGTPALEPLPAVFVATGPASGGFLTVSGFGTPGSSVTVRVRINGETYDQDPALVDNQGRFSAQAGLFGPHRSLFTLSAFARLGAGVSPETSTQTVLLDLNGPPAAPAIAPMGVSASRDYAVSWNAVTHGFIYELQESTVASFASVTETRWPTPTTESFTGKADGAYHYRVRAWSELPENRGLASAWSAVEDVVVAYQFPAGGVVVTEILYDPAGTDTNREWVEIHNKTSQSVDLAGWKVHDGSDHSLTFVQGGSVLAAGGYAVIAASASSFIAEYSTAGSAGWMVIDSVLSLSNTADTVAVKDAAGVVYSSLTYANSAPWPAAANGVTLERVSVNGADNDPSNWQAGSAGGQPGAPTLPALTVPVLNAVPGVFVSTGGAGGGFLTVSGAGAPFSDVVVVVRVNGNAFEQSPIYVDASGTWTGQVGIFGTDGTPFQISAYGKRGVSQTAESAAQSVALETDGVPNLDPVPAVFASGGSGGFLALSGTAVPGSEVTPVVRVNGNDFPQAPVTAGADGRFTASAGLFGADGQVFKISLLGSVNGTPSARQGTALDLDGNPAGVPLTAATPAVFSTAAPGGFLTISGEAAPGSDVVVVVRVNGNSFEQTPIYTDAAGDWTGQVGIFGDDCTVVQISAYSRRGAAVSGESASQTTTLDVNGQALCVPTLEGAPSVFVSTSGAGGGFIALTGSGLPGSEVVVRVRVNGNVFDQDPALVGANGRYAAQAGLFGAHRDVFTLSAFARQGAASTAETSTQSVTLDLLGPPSAPALAAMGTSQSGNYAVSWNAVSNALLYELQEATVSTFVSATDVRWPAGTSENFSRPNGTYHYRVRAWSAAPENGGLSSAWSASEDVVVSLATPPAAPVIAAMGTVTSSDFAVSWSASAGAALYELQEATVASFAAITDARWPASPGESFNRPDGAYYYRVRGWTAAPENDGVSGAWSATEDVTVAVPGVPTFGPSGLAPSAITPLPGTPQITRVAPDGNLSAVAGAPRGTLLNYNTTVGGWAGGGFTFDDFGTPAVETQNLSAMGELRFGLVGDPSEVTLELIDAAGAKFSARLTGLSASTERVYAVPVSSMTGSLNLTAVRLIYFIVSSPNVSGSLTMNRLPPADAAAPVIANLASSNLNPTVANVGWTTDEPATTQVEYGPTPAFGSSTAVDNTLVTTHSWTLAGLTPGTTYYWRAKSRDAAGNEAVSAAQTFATPGAADTTPPVLSGLAASGVTQTGALISWTSDEPSTSQVEYGTTAALGQSTAPDPGLVLSHAATISGLAPGTLYHYRARSADAAGNSAASAIATFTTAASTVPAPAGLVISEILYNPSGSDATHEWVEIHNLTDQPVDLTGWKLFEAGVNHSLTFVQGGSVLAAGGYAVIADSATRFLLDYSTAAGSGSWLVIDSAFSLSNAGETLALKDPALAAVSSLTYSGAAPWPAAAEGQSLARVSASGADNDPANWTAGAATPGAGAAPAPPGTPALAAMGSSSTGDYDVSWSAAAGATVYELVESTVSDFSVVTQTFWPAQTTVSVTEQGEGTYYYRVRGWTALPGNGGLAGAWSASEDVVVDLPAVPSAAIVTPMSLSTTGDYDVTWSTCCNTTIYELQESESPGFETLLATYWSPDTLHSITGRTDGTYYYRVRGWTTLPESGGVSGPWSPQEDMVVDYEGSLGVVCDTNIGPEGGTAPSNGFVELHVPRGVLGAAMTLSVTPLDTRHEPPAQGSPGIPVRMGYDGTALAAAEFGPDGTTFASPVKIRLKFLDKDNDGYPELAPGGPENEVPNHPDFHKSRLKVFWFTGGRWTLVGGQVDADGFVTAETTHFSKYALFPAGAASPAPRERFVTPNRDGVNDAASFGTKVTRVEIFDVTGLSVWTGTGDGVTAIQWAGVDEGNNVVETGPYIYRAQDADGGVTNGVIVVAK